MKIRLSEKKDLVQIMKIYEIARQIMRENGNDKQWINGFPQEDLIRSDIDNQISYVFEENGEVCGVFALIIGDDPTYQKIVDGQWPNNNPYGTIHRIAGNGKCHGLVKQATDFALSKISTVRIDTHELNLIMQHTVTKLGYKRCGIIFVDDGSPRIAFQYN